MNAATAPYQSVVRPAIDGNPFKGPFPLGVGDPIFGRDREVRELLSLLVARRLVLLHAVSGCGKTSLIEAGVRPRLPDRRLTGLPTVRFAAARTSYGPVKNPLTAAVVRSLSADLKTGDKSLAAAAGPMTLSSEIDRISALHSPDGNSFDCFIFDQFEEVLTLPGVSEDARVAFFKDLGLALERSDRWAVFAIRDDYLGALEPYVRYLPTQLATRLRLTQLTREQAKEAIVKLSEESSIQFTREAADRTARELASADGSVEPVYLQVACRHLWGHSHDQQRKDVRIEDVTLLNQGDAKRGAGQTPVDQAIRTYYDDCIAAVVGSHQESQRRLRGWFGSELIELTSHGERRRQTLWTPESMVTEREIESLQNRYLIRQDHRDGIWIELAHDRLVGPIIESNNQWQRHFRQPWQETAEKWKKSGRDSALLLVDAQLLAEAQNWAAGHAEFIAPHDRDFLERSQTEARFRHRVKQITRGSMALATIVILAAAAAFVFGLRSQIDAANAKKQAEVERAKAKEEALDALNARQRADDASKAALEAKNQAEMARNRAIEQENEAFKARVERDQAIQRSYQAAAEAQKEIQRADEDRRNALAAVTSAAAKVIQSEQLVSQADQVASALRSFGLAHEAIARSRQEGLFSSSLDALRELATSPGAPASVAQQHREVLVETLKTLRDQFSRSLLMQSWPTNGFVQSLAASESSGCIHYLNQDGALLDLSDRTIKCETPANTGDPAQTDVASATVDFRFPTASAFSSDGTRAVIGTALGRVRTMKETGEIRPYHGQKHEVTAVAISSSGRYLVASSSLWSFSVRDLVEWPTDEELPKRVYRVPSAGIKGWFAWLTIFRGQPTQIVKSLAVYEGSDSKGLVAVGRQDGTVDVYRLQESESVLRIPGPLSNKTSQAQLDSYEGHTKPVIASAFNRNGELLATGGQDGRIFIWRIPRSAAPRTAPQYVYGGVCNGSSESVAFSPDDRMLAVGCQDGSIILLDIPALRQKVGDRPEPLETLRGQFGDVRNLAFDANRRRLFASGSKAQIDEWYVPTGSELANRRALIGRIQETADSISKAGPTELSATKPELIGLLESLEPLRVLAVDRDQWDSSGR